MIPPFDIFRVNLDNQPLWLEPAATLDEAKARVQELGKSRPGKYLIYSMKTGHRVLITIQPSEESAT